MSNLAQKIFSITNSSVKSHKIIRIFGIKFSLKTNEKMSKKQLLAEQKKFEKIVDILKSKDTINITFMVALSSIFPAQPFLDYLLAKNNPRYKVKILIVPDLRFGLDKAKELQNKCFEELSQKYNSDIIVIVPLNENEDKINLKSFTDVIFCPFPYDVTHYKYSLKNLIKIKILPMMVNYGYFRSKYDRNLISSLAYSRYWKIFVENKKNLSEYKKFQTIEAKNCVLAGYCKMDKYDSLQKSKPKKRKTIMIAPHHSVDDGYNSTLKLSNFCKYADFFLELPKKYPDIDWIFRPHPALFLCLEQDKLWGRKRVEKYTDEMKSIKNVRYSDSGNYLADFRESDGLIQDCGSFLVDYFYTNKPQCYMLKAENELDEVFSDFGKSCLDNVYKAFNQDEIINFIDNVIVNNADFMKQQREKFAKDEVMLNYPNVSKVMEEYFNEIFETQGVQG